MPLTQAEKAFMIHQLAMLNYVVDSYAILDAFRDSMAGYELAHKLMILAASEGGPKPGMVVDVIDDILKMAFPEKD